MKAGQVICRPAPIDDAKKSSACYCAKQTARMLDFRRRYFFTDNGGAPPRRHRAPR